jgi:hypothetical protein
VAVPKRVLSVVRFEFGDGKVRTVDVTVQA